MYINIYIYIHKCIYFVFVLLALLSISSHLFTFCFFLFYSDAFWLFCMEYRFCNTPRCILFSRHYHQIGIHIWGKYAYIYECVLIMIIKLIMF
jgi:hypothetical protein